MAVGRESWALVYHTKAVGSRVPTTWTQPRGRRFGAGAIVMIATPRNLNQARRDLVVGLLDLVSPMCGIRHPSLYRGGDGQGAGQQASRLRSERTSARVLLGVDVHAAQGEWQSETRALLQRERAKARGPALDGKESGKQWAALNARASFAWLLVPHGELSDRNVC